jgi:XTP/dITP diphosphohydrolase
MTTPGQAMFPCVLATQNAHKIDEIAPHLSSSLQWLTLKQANWTGGVLREDADTFEGNALQKAVQGYRGTMLPTLADDSGLVVPDLEGAPGVRSARYAGEQATDAENRAKLMEVLAGRELPAYFVCVLAWVWGDVQHTVRGEVLGKIVPREQGTFGFGYDALFIPNAGDGRTFAEMLPHEKQAMSHRAAALAAFSKLSLNQLGLVAGSQQAFENHR